MSHGQVDFHREPKVKPSAQTVRHNLPESTAIEQNHVPVLKKSETMPDQYGSTLNIQANKSGKS